MNIEQARIKSLYMHHAVQETFPFDENVLAIKIGEKMFSVLILDKPDMIILKCDPDMAVELAERYEAISPAFHFNKKHWIQIEFNSDAPDALIEDLIARSFNLVASKLTRKLKSELGV